MVSPDAGSFLPNTEAIGPCTIQEKHVSSSVKLAPSDDNFIGRYYRLRGPCGTQPAGNRAGVSGGQNCETAKGGNCGKEKPLPKFPRWTRVAGCGFTPMSHVVSSKSSFRKLRLHRYRN